MNKDVAFSDVVNISHGVNIVTELFEESKTFSDLKSVIKTDESDLAKSLETLVAFRYVNYDGEGNYSLSENGLLAYNEISVA